MRDWRENYDFETFAQVAAVVVLLVVCARTARSSGNSNCLTEDLMAITTTEIPVTLSKDEILRYSRHLIMPEVGMEGQQKLKAARVLCIGTGGLGSPLALYLAAAGVGTLGMVDFDVVDYTNLQRQIIHSTADVGRKKLDSAADKLKAHQSVSESADV